jgi:hypothetical protein
MNVDFSRVKKEAFSSFQTCQLLERAQERPTFQINLIGGVFYALNLNLKKLKNTFTNGC